MPCLILTTRQRQTRPICLAQSSTLDREADKAYMPCLILNTTEADNVYMPCLILNWTLDREADKAFMPCLFLMLDWETDKAHMPCLILNTEQRGRQGLYALPNANKKAQHISWHTAKCNTIALEMKYKRLIYSHSLAEAVVSQKQFTTALSSCCAYQSNVV